MSVRVTQLGAGIVGLAIDTDILKRRLYVDPFGHTDVLLSINEGDDTLAQMQVSRADLLQLAENLYQVEEF